MDLEILYRENLLEHYHHPRNVGHLVVHDFSSTEQNPSCGDQIHIEGRIDNGIITALGFVGSGCILSQSVASMVTESCTGKTIEQVLAFNKDFVVSLIGTHVGPTRLRCALLSLSALQLGLRNYLHDSKQKTE
jgi:nitrogen fixation NifU-like protein